MAILLEARDVAVTPQCGGTCRAARRLDPQCGRFTGMDFTGVIKPEPKVIKSGTNTINTSIFPLQSIGGYNLG